MGTGAGVAGCLVELAGGVGVNLGSGSVVAVGATWEVFVGIGVTGIVGVAARVGAAVGAAVLEGVGALVQAQAASKTDTASANANARGFHCAEPRISSISQINRFVWVSTYNVARDTHPQSGRVLRVIETDR